MTQIGQTLPPVNGGRISTPKFRDTVQQGEEFKGLPAGITRINLLQMVKDAGREVGITDAMMNLLEYYILLTREQDWKEDSRPLMYQSQYKTALHFGVSERQIQKLEGALFNVGALTWNDSGNYRRYGVRDEKTGELKYAYGVDLSPLADLYPVLQQKLQEKELRDAAWMEEKRRISWYRAQIRAILAEAAATDLPAAQLISATEKYNAIALPIRVYMTLEILRELGQQHKSLYEELRALIAASIQEQATQKDCGLTQNCSSMDEQNNVNIHYTNHPPFDKSNTSSPLDTGFQGSVIDPPVIIGKSRTCVTDEASLTPDISEKIANISWKHILNAASPRFQDHLHSCYGNKPRGLTWNDIFETAFAIRRELGISKSAWTDACDKLGREGAAICIMVIDQKAQDPSENIRSPGGYLRGMLQKAKEGKLNLHGSVFGLLKRAEEKVDA